MKRSLLSLCFLLCSCAANEFDDIIITSATVDIDLSSVAVILGGSGGSGVLTFTQENGITGSCNVQMRGPSFGVILAITEGTYSFDLDFPSPTIPLSDVFGAYRGSSASAALIIGGENHQGTNRNDVSFNDGSRTLGLGLWGGIGYLRIIPPNRAECTF